MEKWKKSFSAIKYFTSIDSVKSNCLSESNWQVSRPNFRSNFMVLPHYPRDPQVIDNCMTGRRKKKSHDSTVHFRSSSKMQLFSRHDLTGPLWRWGVGGLGGGSEKNAEACWASNAFKTKQSAQTGSERFISCTSVLQGGFQLYMLESKLWCFPHGVVVYKAKCRKKFVA